jgi:uncharacterized protein (DUF2237 family)
MAYAILRTEKYKTRNTIAGLVGHHLRIPGSKLDNVDASRSHLNVVIGAHDRDSFNKAVEARIDTCTRKPRPDANKVVEMLLGASPEFFEGKSYAEQKSYLSDCVDFAKQFFGAENIVGAYMHFDEKTPHVSVMVVPIETSVRKTKKQEREVTTLNASHYLGGHERMVQMQTDFALFVRARGHDLQRGEPKAETKREHQPLGAHWLEQVKTIDAAAAASADLLNDAAIQSQAAADLFEHAAQEANRTGFESKTLTAQREAVAVEQAALAELRAAMQRQGAALDKEWSKLREKAGDMEKREGALSMRESQAVSRLQALDIRYKTAVKEADRTTETLESIRFKEDQLRKSLSAISDRQSDLLRAEKVDALVSRPELLGMLEYLSEHPEARKLLALAQVDPAMAEVVRANLEVAAGMGSNLNAADWGSLGEETEWSRVVRAREPIPLPPGFDFGGPSGP